MVGSFWCDSSLISTINWFPSVLWHSWFGRLACKIIPEITYKVLSGSYASTLLLLKVSNPTFSIRYYPYWFCFDVSSELRIDLHRVQTNGHTFTKMNWLDFEGQRSRSRLTARPSMGKSPLLWPYNIWIDLHVLLVVLQFWAKWGQKVKSQGWGRDLAIYDKKCSIDGSRRILSSYFCFTTWPPSVVCRMKKLDRDSVGLAVNPFTADLVKALHFAILV